MFKPNTDEQAFLTTPHAETFETILKCCEERRWVPRPWRFTVSKSQQDAAFALLLDVPEVVTLGRDEELVLGVTCSTSPHYGTKLYCGLVLPDKDGGGGESIALDQVMSFPKERLESAIDRYPPVAWDAHDSVQALKTRGLSHEDIRILLLTAGSQKIIPWSRTGRIYDDVVRVGPQTSWSLLLAALPMIRMSAPTRHMELQLRFLKLLPTNEETSTTRGVRR